MERLKGALEIVAVCSRKNKSLQLWSEQLPLSTARSLITSSDGMLQTDFEKLLNKVWEMSSACSCLICAQGWTSLGNILHAVQCCQNIREVLAQTCAGIGGEGGVSCAAGQTACPLPKLLVPLESLMGLQPPPWWSCYIERAGSGQSGLICWGKRKSMKTLYLKSLISCFFAMCFLHWL